eukprot:COSAG02_NODE_19937_length_857_cov_1.072559_1_plen_75_part_01
MTFHCKTGSDLLIRVPPSRLLDVISSKDAVLVTIRALLIWRQNVDRQISDRKRLSVATRILVRSSLALSLSCVCG